MADKLFLSLKEITCFVLDLHGSTSPVLGLVPDTMVGVDQFDGGGLTSVIM